MNDVSKEAAQKPRILVACIGNIFLGDDAFGVEVAKRLTERNWPDEVSIRDFGIRGFDLAYALMDSEVTIFVDAIKRGEPPGTLFVIEPDLSEIDLSDAQSMMVETHGMHPMKVLSLARSMGAELGRILLVGCEPETFGPEEEGLMGLSERVEAAVDEAVRLIESLVTTILKGEHKVATQ